MDILATIDRDGYSGISALMATIRELDIHKWIIGAETGAGGFKHWQCRFKTRLEDKEEVTGLKWDEKSGTVKQIKETVTADAQLTRILRQKLGDGVMIYTAKCSDAWEYETKEGCYLASWDTMEVRRTRFGKPTWAQKEALQALQRTNDREVMVWYDPTGNIGKSWLTNHLYEKGLAYCIPATMKDVEMIIKTTASLASKDREAGYPPRPYVIIDIPRSWKWSNQLYTAIETIKDGLIMDPRYTAQPINIRGVKVMVMTNTRPQLDKLSKDRWWIHEQSIQPSLP
ncbi:replication associated protein [Chlorocebus cynosuros associated smacovirus]|uniref:Replication associated protein n=1 Tax=Chlorocebus cynosuros associated smacovirus TaxID=2213167 RepID=A0A455R6C7_9VIRU|nr:replication associated protein [Chlorocebus cynosuros associated smacovirus]BBE29360.1 replication associated protein [Chlorocebus cynosuros associated smacovirus]